MIVADLGFVSEARKRIGRPRATVGGAFPMWMAPGGIEARALGPNHRLLTVRFAGCHHRLTDVAGNVVKKVLKSA